MATKTEQQVCTHCHGTGIEPQRELDTAWTPLLDEIRDIGSRRKAVSRKRNLADLTTLEQTTKELLAVTNKARAAGVPKVVVAETAGLSRVQLDNILKGTPGGARERAS